MGAVLTLALTIAAWAQGPQAGPQAGPQGQHGPGMHGQHAPGGGLGGMGGGMIHGTVEVNAESKAVWDRITDLQVQTRAKQWELFTLKSQGAGEEQLQAKVQELQALREQLRAAHEELRPYVTMPEGAGLGTGTGAGRGQGGEGQGLHRGGGHGAGTCDGTCEDCDHGHDA